MHVVIPTRGYTSSGTYPVGEIQSGDWGSVGQSGRSHMFRGYAHSGVYMYVDERTFFAFPVESDNAVGRVGLSASCLVYLQSFVHVSVHDSWALTLAVHLGTQPWRAHDYSTLLASTRGHTLLASTRGLVFLAYTREGFHAGVLDFGVLGSVHI